MFCPQCRTEFIGWRGKCPDCKVLLVDQLSPELGSVEKILPYNDLVDLVKKNNGQISIGLIPAEVERQKKWRFPFLGYGYAWTEELSGECGADLKVSVTITDVNRKKSLEFPYLGYGYAWARKGDLELKVND